MMRLQAIAYGLLALSTLLCGTKMYSEFQQPRDLRMEVVHHVPALNATMQEWVDQLARPYTPKSIPCFPPDDEGHGPIDKGFVFTKPFKTASTTAASVHIRLSHLAAAQKWEHCRMRYDHDPAFKTFFGSNETFAWSVVREPHARALSHAVYSATRKNQSIVTEEDMRKAMKEEPEGHYMHFLTWIGDDITTFDHFDFLAITERFDESMVVLSMLLDVPLSHEFYRKEKSGYTFMAGSPGHCAKVPRVSDKVRATARNMAGWDDYHAWDTALYHAANKSLDLTIDALGRDVVEEKLKRFRRHVRQAEEHCRAHTQPVCDADGKLGPVGRFSTCFERDMGCSSDCLNEFSVTHGEFDDEQEGQ